MFGYLLLRALYEFYVGQQQLQKAFHCLSFPTGTSALVIPPDAVFPCDLGDVDGLHRRDTTLDDLHQRILRFIYAYAPGADTYITEE